MVTLKGTLLSKSNLTKNASGVMPYMQQTKLTCAGKNQSRSCLDRGKVECCLSKGIQELQTDASRLCFIGICICPNSGNACLTFVFYFITILP